MQCLVGLSIDALTSVPGAIAQRLHRESAMKAREDWMRGRGWNQKVASGPEQSYGHLCSPILRSHNHFEGGM